jgi:hypothetical protein
MPREPMDFMDAAIQAVRSSDLAVFFEAAHTGQNGFAQPNPPAPSDDLQAVTTLLAELHARLKTDAAAAFSPEIIAALARVRQHDPAAWARAREVLRKNRVSMRDLNRCIAEIAGNEPTADTDQREGRRAGDALPDCPAPSMVIPSNFSLDENGTYESKARRDPWGGTAINTVLVAHAPLVISGRLRDIETGTQALQIYWRRPDGWHERTVDRAVALDSHRIIELAGEGFPVFSNNTAGLTKYLEAAEVANYATLPTAYVSSHLGWQGRNGEYGFLVGRTLVGTDGRIIQTPRTLDFPGGAIPSGAVAFRGLTPGDEQIVDAWHQQGSFDEWRRALRLVRDRPRVLAGFYGALVPPLLPIVGCPNFIMDWAHRTSAGKTTTLRLAASVWGNPNEDAVDSVLRSWDSTQVYIERGASIISGLPLILDETKRVKDPRLVANVMYEVATGQGRGRGNVRSTNYLRTWRTVLLSTGEAPAVSFTQDGGTRARCLEIRGAPFGDTSPETATVVNKLNAAIKGNYGHAGLAFVQWLIRHKHEWPRIEEEYRALIQHYCRQAPTGTDPAVVGRLAQYAAALHQAAVYANVALDLSEEMENPLDPLWTDLANEASDAAGEVRALRDTVSWAYSQAQSFYGRELTPKMPPGGWSGRWDNEVNWEFIAFFPTVLQKILADFGYSPEAILAGWRERGWLLVDGDRGRYTTRQRVADDRPHLVAIRYEAIKEVEGA